MNFSLLILAIVANIAVVYGKGFRCDYKYYASAHGWFKLHSDPELYEDAKDICKMEGAVLASAAKTWVRDIMLKTLNENPTISSVYTMLDDDDTGKPIMVYDHTDATAVEAGVGVERPFICYYDGVENVALNDCGTIDNDYEMFTNTKNCYKFHSNPRTWGKALQTCEAEGGYLAVVNSVDEANHLASVQYAWTDKVFMGFSANQAGKWLTVSDVRLSASGYTFGPGQPVNAVGDKVCGAMGRDVQLYNVLCSVPMVFFCEKDPNSLLCDPPTTTSTTTTTTTTPRPPPPPPPPTYPPWTPPPPPPTWTYPPWTPPPPPPTWTYPPWTPPPMPTWTYPPWNPPPTPRLTRADLIRAYNSADVCSHFGLMHVFLITLGAMLFNLI